MPSPFPGMDPFLQFRWRDVHVRLITYITDALQDQLPAGLLARVEERVSLETEGGKENGRIPDTEVIELRPPAVDAAASQGRVALAQPEILDTSAEPATDRYIQVIDVGSGNRVVTFLEVLSPTNKVPGADRAAYLKKQLEVRNSDSNLVEIDLVRAGAHTVAFPLDLLPVPRRTTYYACVRRATTPTKAEVYRIPLLAKLPVVSVPLRPTDADVALDLQEIFDQVYKRGRYEVELNYNHQPDPPFYGAEAEAVDEFLRMKGARSGPIPAKPKRKPPRPKR